MLLVGFCALCLAAGPRIHPSAPKALLAVAAMAVQNALAQTALQGAPSTAVMTTNVTRFTMDIGDVLLGRDPAEVARARAREQHAWPAILGYTAASDRWSLALPGGLALCALALGPYGTHK